jgi:DNA-binding SARP family transcriptional activator
LSRDTIVALLWPESEPERARNSLSQSISILRRELAAADLLLGTAELRVNTEVFACDVIDFERCIAADDLESATRLYTGPFLDGVFLKNVPEFERWVDQERSRLEHVQGDALERLATRATAAKDYLSAVRFRRRRASLTPSDSRAARELMAALVASGDSAGALAHYRAHRTLLHDDLGVEPDASLVEFAAVVRQGTSLPAVVRAAPEATTAPATRAELGTPATTAQSASVMRRRRVLLRLAATVVLVVGVGVTWVAKSRQSNVGPPKPPAHDSLRLRIVAALLPSDPADATLLQQVREAALAEMEQDPWLFVVTPSAWQRYGAFTGLSDAVMAQTDTIHKYARKARTHAIVDFGVSRAGNGFVITADARAASTDSSLGAITEAATGAADLPAAMHRLGRGLRERLVAARSALPPTTWSMNTTDEPPQAIEQFVEGLSESGRRNWIEAARRAEAAVRFDSTFAIAWELRRSSLINAHLSVEDQLTASSAAYRFRGRVRSPFDRLDIAASYFRAIGDPELAFYDSMARLRGKPPGNMGVAYWMVRKRDLATQVYRSLRDTSHKYIRSSNSNFVGSLLDEGNVAEARREVAALNRADSTNRFTLQSRNLMYTAIRDWESLDHLGKDWLGLAKTTIDSATAVQSMRNAAAVRGEFARFDGLARLNSTILKNDESSGDRLTEELQRAQLRATVAGDTVRARAIADSGLATTPWESLRPMDRPYLAMLLYLASVGDVKRGADMAREWSRETPVEFKLRDSLDVLVGRGELALSSGDAGEALRLFRLADVRDCQTCFYPRYGRAFDAMSMPDSARVWFERYAGATYPEAPLGDAVELAHTYRRLGELSEARGDFRAAVAWYEQFTALWAKSDLLPSQAAVRAIRGRMERLRKWPR